jgi:hypothetical protein
MRNTAHYNTPEAREALARYERVTAATLYCVGYNFEGKLYVNFLRELRPEWCYVASNSKGELVLKMYINKLQAAALRNKGGVEQGKALNDSNNGDAFERWFFEHYKLGDWNRNSVPFYERGDAELFGEQVQIKFMNATICKLSTLNRKG